jgi:hypothetical protein
MRIGIKKALRLSVDRVIRIRILVFDQWENTAFYAQC